MGGNKGKQTLADFVYSHNVPPGGFEPVSSRSISPRWFQQLLKQFLIFDIYAVTLLMCTAAGSDPDAIRGGQLPNPNECN